MLQHCCLLFGSTLVHAPVQPLTLPRTLAMHADVLVDGLMQCCFGALSPLYIRWASNHKRPHNPMLQTAACIKASAQHTISWSTCHTAWGATRLHLPQLVIQDLRNLSPWCGHLAINTELHQTINPGFCTTTQNQLQQAHATVQHSQQLSVRTARNSRFCAAGPAAAAAAASGRRRTAATAGCPAELRRRPPRRASARPWSRSSRARC